jgi:hypothetical protein
VPNGEVDRRLADLAEAGQEQASMPTPAVIRRRARRRRIRKAAATTVAMAVVAVATWAARPSLVRDGDVVGPGPAVTAPPGAVPWVHEPARPRAPTSTTPGVRPADLAVSIDAPSRAVIGRPLRYSVTIVNAGDQSVPLRPCPNYDQRLVVEGARPSLQPWRLNCHQVAAIHPGERVTFMMEFAVPATLPPGQAALIWNLDLGPGAQFKPIQMVRP